MKNLYTVCILFFFYDALAFGQSFIGMPDSNAMWINAGAIWESEWGPPDNEVDYVLHYFTDGSDTVIGAETYFKISSLEYGYKGAMRNDSGRVFFIEDGESLEKLQADFTVGVGDTIFDLYFGSSVGLSEAIIQDVDSILIGSKYHKRVIIEGGGVSITDGIGTSYPFLSFGGGVSGGEEWLYCMSVNDTIRFPTWSLGSCNLEVVGNDSELESDLFAFPNPSDGAFHLRLNAGVGTFDDMKIYDQSGRTVNPLMVFVGGGIEIFMDQFDSGVYTVVIVFNGISHSTRIVKR